MDDGTEFPLSLQVEAALLKALNEARGQEICGYLIRPAEGEPYFQPLSNRMASVEGVFLSAIDARRVRERAGRRGDRLLAWVHSHPGDAVLSDEDRSWLQRSEIPWIIVARQGIGLRATAHEPVASL